MSQLNDTIEKVFQVLESAPGHHISGEVRPTHPKHWASALHKITEQILDRPIHLVSDPAVNNTYTLVSQAVLWLERGGFVSVQRTHGSRAYQANGVDGIWLK